METKTTKQQGMLTGATAHAPAATQAKALKPVDKLKVALSADSVKKQFENALQEGSNLFIASVIDLYNGDTKLQNCDPNQVIVECLKAATLKLPINKQLGFAYIVPYKDHGIPRPQFQIGYKGYIQLALRSGFYKHINTATIYEGEFSGANKLTGEIDVSGEKASDEVAGYLAYIETVNGFSKAAYWRKDAIIKHAQKYSKSYKAGSDIWTSNFDEMAEKTALRNLLSHYGLMSIELQNAVAADLKDDHTAYGPELTGDDMPDAPDKIEGAYADVNPDTGEVAEGASLAE